MLAAMIAGISGGPASAQESVVDARDAFVAGETAFAAADYRRAVEHFEAARDAGLAGPAVHYNIGVSYYRLGEYERAGQTFSMIAERFPAMRELAVYNLGLALLRQDRQAEAVAAFERAASAPDEVVAGLARAMLERLDTAAPSDGLPRSAWSWTRLFDLKLGHDDNVVLVDESVLAPDQASGSPFAELFAYAGGASGAGGRFRFDASAYLVRYPDAGSFDQNTVRVAGAHRWSWGDWRLDAGPHYQHSMLGGDGFERRLGVSADLRLTLDARSGLAIRLTLDDVDELDDRFGFVAGRREQLRLGFDRRGDSGRIALGYEIERNDREDPGVSPLRNRLYARYRRQLNADWSADLGASYRASRYRDLPETRSENLIELAVGASRALPGEWQLVGEYLWADNDSNMDVFSYRRQRIGLGVSKVF